MVNPKVCKAFKKQGVRKERSGRPDYFEYLIRPFDPYSSPSTKK